MVADSTQLDCLQTPFQTDVCFVHQGEVALESTYLKEDGYNGSGLGEPGPHLY